MKLRNTMKKSVSLLLLLSLLLVLLRKVMLLAPSLRQYQQVKATMA